MIIHQTDYLQVYFDESNNLTIQTWIKSPENVFVFKQEMLLFVAIQQKHKASKALWLHKNFTFIMTESTKKWAEQHVVHPCFAAGVKKFAFVVSKDVFSHLSVVESFDGLNIPLMPRHFVSEKEAMDWLINDISPLSNQEYKVSYEGADDDGNILLKIKAPTDASNVLRLFKKFQSNNTFQSKNLIKFQSLTTREKEILLKYAHGHNADTIAKTLNISIFTVRTHWRNIKQKLKINSLVDATKFLHFYH